MLQANGKHATPALAMLVLSVLALGGCQSPLYSGTPDDMGSPYHGRSNIGGDAPSEEDEQPAEESSTGKQDYEYRGGRDPVTGRAKTQM